MVAFCGVGLLLWMWGLVSVVCFMFGWVFWVLGDLVYLWGFFGWLLLFVFFPIGFLCIGP